MGDLSITTEAIASSIGYKVGKRNATEELSLPIDARARVANLLISGFNIFGPLKD